MNTSRLETILPANIYGFIYDAVNKYNVNTPLRLAHFMAQTAHESNNFKAVRENLNYSALGLLRVFPKYFNDKNVNDYAGKPEKIANRVYASRMGNGGEATGEGWKYRGRGYLQVTGKGNYGAFSKFINEDCVENPELVADKYPMDSAIWFFNKNYLWKICDEGASKDNVLAVTRRVNGGTNGLDDRIAKFNKFMRILSQD